MIREPQRDVQPLRPHPPIRRFYSSESERREFVGKLFDDSAVQYEWVNRVMSLGSGQRYRRDALRRAGVGPGMTVLDLCTGSGQVARAAVDLVGADGEVFGLDASCQMLIEARKYVDTPMSLGLVETLPFADGTADVVTMGYALRHIADLRRAFGEFLRVLKPGGTLLMIEFSRPRSGIAYALARLYLCHLVPMIARLRGRPAADMMRYFWDTIDNCIPPEKILEALREAGFDNPRRDGQLELFAEYSASKPSRTAAKQEDLQP